MRKELITWLQNENPDVFMVQETKAQPEQIDIEAFEKLGYYGYFQSAEKRGYSGVATFSKIRPDKVVEGFGNEIFDREGRTVRIDIGDISILNTYFPSGTTGELRQAFKMEFLAHFYEFAQKLKKERPNLVLSGDYNICHKPIDIHNPVANKNTSGFLPEEREWVTKFLDSGFEDSFRHFHSEPHRYTWWSYRAQARKKNLGWRIDYQMVSEALKPRMQNADILSDAMHSDHCPTLLLLN